MERIGNFMVPSEFEKEKRVKDSAIFYWHHVTRGSIEQ
jgi:hypothetical protein